MTVNIAPAAGRQGAPGVGEQGPPGSRDLRQRTVTGAGGIVGGGGNVAWTYQYETDDIVYIDAADDGAQYIFTLPSGADSRNTPIYLKRINTDPRVRVIIRTDDGGTIIDGGTTDITLSVTTAFGVNSGESVTMMYDDDSSQWRVL